MAFSGYCLLFDHLLDLLDLPGGVTDYLTIWQIRPGPILHA